MIIIAILIFVIVAILLGVYLKRTTVERMKAKGDIEGLIRVLNQESESARRRAMKALAEIGEPAVEPLVRAEDSGKVYQFDKQVFQEQVTRALVEIGAPAVGPLIRALKDKDVVVRFRAAEALGEIGDTRAGDPLVEALKEEKRYDPRPLVEALQKIGAPAVKPLIGVLQDGESTIDVWVVDILAVIGEPAEEPFIQALKEPSRPIRSATAARFFCRNFRKAGGRTNR